MRPMLITLLGETNKERELQKSLFYLEPFEITTFEEFNHDTIKSQVELSDLLIVDSWFLDRNEEFMTDFLRGINRPKLYLFNQADLDRIDKRLIDERSAYLTKPFIPNEVLTSLAGIYETFTTRKFI